MLASSIGTMEPAVCQCLRHQANTSYGQSMPSRPELSLSNRESPEQFHAGSILRRSIPTSPPERSHEIPGPSCFNSGPGDDRVQFTCWFCGRHEYACCPSLQAYAVCDGINGTKGLCATAFKCR